MTSNVHSFITLILMAIYLGGCSGDRENDQASSIKDSNPKASETPKVEAVQPEDKSHNDADNKRDPSKDAVVSQTDKSDQKPINNKEQSKDDLEIANLIKELEESLAKIDDKLVMQNYGESGSGLDVDHTRPLLISNRSINIAPSSRSIALILNDSDAMISNVTSISGATSISSDPSGFGINIALSGDYLFAYDKHDLSEDAQASLENIWALYKEHQGTLIQVRGHSDSKGSEDYNAKLSKRRADSVKNWFITKGVVSNSITTEGFGESDPVAPNTIDGQDNPEGRALNRRVEISIKTQKKVMSLPTT